MILVALLKYIHRTGSLEGSRRPAAAGATGAVTSAAQATEPRRGPREGGGSACARTAVPEAPHAGFGSVLEALRAGRAMTDYLNSPAARDLDGAACGEALVQVGAILSGLTAVQNGLLRRFDADSAHDADGYASTAAWLACQTGLGRRDAKAAVRQMRLLGRHPLLDDAAADGAVTVSWAREMADWTRRIGDEDLQPDADQILLEAARAGADLDGLRVIAQAAYEAWRAARPDEDPPGKGFQDRFLQLDATMDGAGRLAGDLTPECAAAVTAVLEALGKKRGPEDDRTAAQRFHDALQEGCELLIRAKMVPDRAGSDTRVDVEIPLSALRGMDGASLIEEAWLRARAGQPGYLAGKDAEAIACDALIVPIVTGSPDWAVIGQMITLVTDSTPAPRTAAAGPADRPPTQASRAAPVSPAAPARPPSPASPPTPATPPGPRGRSRRRRSRRSCSTRWPGSRSTSSPAPAASPPRCAAPSLAPSSTARAPPWTPATATTSPRRSAAPSSTATSTAPGPPAATAPPPSATSTTSNTKKTAAPPASRPASCSASTTTTSASTGGDGKSNSCPTASVRATGPQGQILQSHPPPTIPTG